jgi:aminoglycoside/choline kinase family phosphotransferase
VTPLPSGPADIDSSWLTSALGLDGEVVAFTAQQIGTGQVGANFRYALEWSESTEELPTSVVVKLASLDAQSRQTGVDTLTYEREVAFYRDVAHTVDICHPHAFHVDIESGTANVVVVMEDLAPREQGDQLAGCSAAHAERAVVEAARLHGPRWGDESLHDIEWLSRRNADTVGAATEGLQMLYPMFVERYGDRLSAEAREAGDQLIPRVRDWFENAPRATTITHGDYRLDNMMFAAPGSSMDRPLVIVDWQTPGHSHGANDVAYFLGAGMFPADREAVDEQMVERYHSELIKYPAASHVTLAECWENYRRYAYSGFLMAVGASIIVGQTNRGDEMFMAMANRHAAQALHLNSAEMIG